MGCSIHSSNICHQPQAGNKALTDEELRLFFKAIGTDGLRAKRDRAIFLALFWCARRVSEITELRWQNISQTMIVDSTGPRMAWTYTFFGKGRKLIADVSEYPLSRHLPCLNTWRKAVAWRRLNQPTRCSPRFLIIEAEAAAMTPSDRSFHNKCGG
jgi:hypothetical protein